MTTTFKGITPARYQETSMRFKEVLIESVIAGEEEQQEVSKRYE